MAAIGIGVAGYAVYSELRPAGADGRPGRPRAGAPVEDEQSATESADDRASLEAYSGRSRETPLHLSPGYWEADRDASGNVWLTGSVSDSSAAFRRSVEAAAAGKTHIVHAGHVLLVDSTGRYWALDNRRPDELLCYDGHAWLPPRRALDRPKTGAAFVKSAVEDAGGTVTFVTTGQGGAGGFHRLARDGTWSFWPFAAAVGGEAHWLNPTLLVLPGGRVAVGPLGVDGEYSEGAMQVQRDRVAGRPLRPRPDLPMVCIGDGSDGVAYVPTDHPDREAWVFRVVALPDGSVITTVTTQFNTFELMLSWPVRLTDADRRQARQWFAWLANAGPARAAAARTRVLRLGPSILPEVEAALRDGHGLVPAAVAALSSIRDVLAGETVRETPLEKALVGGRFRLGGTVTFVGRQPNGQVRLYAQTCFDDQQQADLGPSYLIVDRNGDWSARPLPKGDGDAAWIAGNAGHPYEDPLGNLYMGGWKDRIFTPDGRLLSGVSPGGQQGTIHTSDRDGRVFRMTVAGDWFIVDRRAPEPSDPTALPVEDVRAEAVAPPLGAGENGWLRGLRQLTRIDPDGTRRPVTLPPGYQADHCFPLRDGAVLAWLRTGDEPATPWLYHDNSWNRWDSAGTSDAVHAHAADLVPLLAPLAAAVPADAPLDLFRLGTDGGRGLWFQSYHTDCVPDVPGRTWKWVPRYDLCYHDGARWHDDVWGAILAVEPYAAPTTEPGQDSPPVPDHDPIPDWTLLGGIEGGRALLLLHRTTSHFFSVQYENGTAVVRPIVSDPVDRSNGPTGEVTQFDSLAGRTFIVDARADGTPVAEYQNGRLVPVGPAGLRGQPKLADADRRIWLAGAGTITVVDGDCAFTLAEPAADQPSVRIEQGPDGRVWLVDPAGVSQLQCDGHALTRRPRLVWAGTRPELWPWVDGGNHLWLNAIGGTVGRMNLPPATGTSTTRP